jgi:hypothetical protein
VCGGFAFLSKHEAIQFFSMTEFFKATPANDFSLLILSMAVKLLLLRFINLDG